MASNNPEVKGTEQPGQGPEYPGRREMRREERHRDPLRGLFWGLLLILLGVLFFASEQAWISGDRVWQYFLIGLGAIFILDAIAHFANVSYRRGILGRFIAGIVLIFIGVAFIYGFDKWWPLALIAGGVAILASFWFRRR